jgi:hypothetical protein
VTVAFGQPAGVTTGAGAEADEEALVDGVGLAVGVLPPDVCVDVVAAAALAEAEADALRAEALADLAAFLDSCAECAAALELPATELPPSLADDASGSDEGSPDGEVGPEWLPSTAAGVAASWPPRTSSHATTAVTVIATTAATAAVS